MEFDVAFRKGVLQDMLSILREMREKAEVAAVHESESDEAKPEVEEKIDDDFFVEN